MRYWQSGPIIFLYRHENIVLNLCCNIKMIRYQPNAQITKFSFVLATTKTKIRMSSLCCHFIYDDSPWSQVARMTLRHCVLGTDDACDRMRRKLHRSFLRESLRKRRKELKIQKVGLAFSKILYIASRICTHLSHS